MNSARGSTALDRGTTLRRAGRRARARRMRSVKRMSRLSTSRRSSRRRRRWRSRRRREERDEEGDPERGLDAVDDAAEVVTAEQVRPEDVACAQSRRLRRDVVVERELVVAVGRDGPLAKMRDDAEDRRGRRGSRRPAVPEEAHARIRPLAARLELDPARTSVARTRRRSERSAVGVAALAVRLGVVSSRRQHVDGRSVIAHAWVEVRRTRCPRRG